jgi:hypothetical protein
MAGLCALSVTKWTIYDKYYKKIYNIKEIRGKTYNLAIRNSVFLI